MSFQTSEYESPANGTTTAIVPDKTVVVNINPPREAPRPKANLKSTWVDLAEDGPYAGYQALIKTRFAERINSEFSSSDYGRIRQALREVVLEHNGWADLDADDDAVLPPANQACSIERELAEAKHAELARLNEEMAAVDDTAKVRDDETERELNERKRTARERVQQASDRRLARLLEDASQQMATRRPRCCFWHALSQQELLLLVRAVGSEQKKAFALLFETRNT